LDLHKKVKEQQPTTTTTRAAITVINQHGAYHQRYRFLLCRRIGNGFGDRRRTLVYRDTTRRRCRGLPAGQPAIITVVIVVVVDDFRNAILGLVGPSRSAPQRRPYRIGHYYRSMKIPGVASRPNEKRNDVVGNGGIAVDGR
jgi:hypothetical protein